MNEKELYVWRHKRENGVYLMRNRSCVGGSTAEHFFSVTEDFISALKNAIACEDNEYEMYFGIPYHWEEKADDTMPLFKSIDAEIDGYKGRLTKEVRYHLCDFEKVVLWAPLPEQVKEKSYAPSN